MSIIGFTKMHGLGNDFVVIDNLDGRIKLSKEQVAILCDRHFGVGADGLILVEKKDDVDSISSPQVDCFMNYYNSDGTEAEMCGNGIRCVAKFLKDYYLKDKNNFKIDTRAGIKEVNLEEDGTFSVNMGKPVFIHKDFPNKKQNLEGLEFDFVSLGNPHAVAFVKDLKDFNLEEIGPKIENNTIFPNKINVELVEKINDKEFKVSVWERGCGITLACGTGACAVFVFANKNKNKEEEITIQLPGGNLFLKENEKGEIIMRGTANGTFSGMFEIY
jgi:diaminopimelate epimerase